MTVEITEAHASLLSARQLRRQGKGGKRPRWTKAQDDYVLTRLDKGWTYARIAQGLKQTAKRIVSAIAVRNRVYALGAGVWQGDEISPYQVAQLLAVGHTTVGWWVETGALRSRTVGRLRAISETDLQDFLCDVRHWPKYDPHRIEDDDLRSLVLAKRKGYEFFTLKQVSKIAGYSPSRLLALIHEGRLEAVRDHGLRFVVRNDWLVLFQRAELGG